MSTKTCQFPTGTAYSGPKTCGRPAKYVLKTSDPYHWLAKVPHICGIHKRSATRYGEATIEPLAAVAPPKEHP